MSLQLKLSAGLALFTAACATTETVAPVAAPAPSVPAAPAFLSSDILGAAADDIDALLGAPALRRREGAAEFRRYALAECTLIVILYPDDADIERAAHIEATAKSSIDREPDLDGCLAAG